MRHLAMLLTAISLLITEKFCAAPPTQTNGQQDACDSPYVYGSTCSYKCHPGYRLPANGLASILCTVKTFFDGSQPVIMWDNLPSDCTGILIITELIPTAFWPTNSIVLLACITLYFSLISKTLCLVEALLNLYSSQFTNLIHCWLAIFVSTINKSSYRVSFQHKRLLLWIFRCIIL